MKSRFLFRVCCVTAVLGLVAVGASYQCLAWGPIGKLQALAAQDPGGGQGPGEGRIPLFGKVTAIQSGAIDIMNANGQTVVIKLTNKTEFRKDRQPAKRTDFK